MSHIVSAVESGAGGSTCEGLGGAVDIGMYNSRPCTAVKPEIESVTTGAGDVVGSVTEGATGAVSSVGDGVKNAANDDASRT